MSISNVQRGAIIRNYANNGVDVIVVRGQRTNIHKYTQITISIRWMFAVSQRPNVQQEVIRNTQ